jgi:hypothetical protein
MATPAISPGFDGAKLNSFMEKVVGDMGAALGAQAGEKQIRKMASEAGFTRFRRAAETPFNLVYEARP